MASTGTNIGVEEEFHVVDLRSRELVARAPEMLDRLPDACFTAELQSSVVETNSAVCTGLEQLRDNLVGLRRQAVEVAASCGLGIVAAGTVPLVDQARLSVTPTTRYHRMVEDYQLLAREQLICGTQVHVELPDRDVAVAVAQRVGSRLPILLALSVSSPYWLGADTGYASMRSLVWQRWPTSGESGATTAAEHDKLVDDLLASGAIADRKMIYFDVRPSAHLPTLELRVTDACPDVEDVVLLAGLFRALVAREREAVLAGEPAVMVPPPLMRAAMWRSARSGLEGDLINLSVSPHPIPAASAVTHLVEELRPYLDESGDFEHVRYLAVRALSRGSAAGLQRRAYERRGRLSDVVDDLLVRTSGEPLRTAAPTASRRLLVGYPGLSDEAVGGDGKPTATYAPVLEVLDRLGASGMRSREISRDDEQRSNGVTFGVPGEASTRLFPVDLVPRIVPAEDWATLTAGLKQRARAIDAFLHDVYDERACVKDGIVPTWVIDAAPGLRPVGALMRRQKVRAHVSGMDLVRDGSGHWAVLEDNVRIPSGLGYAVQSRRLSDAVMPDLPRPPALLDPDEAPRQLRITLEQAAPEGAPDSPGVVVLSSGPDDSAWFEHRMLAEEMGVPVATPNELAVEDGIVKLVRHGSSSRVDVLYLRVGEDTLLHSPGADRVPLGPPLLAAIDAGAVTLANAPGNGVGDDKAIYAFVPAMIDYYLGEKPTLADVPTFLCGVPEQLELVLPRLHELVIKPVDGYGGEGVVIGPKSSAQELAAVRRQLLTAPFRYIAQETVGLSTHPTFDGERLSARHVDLRAFVLLGDEATVATAALTRVAPEGSMIVNSSRGGGSKDSWLMGA